jgi:hypothetical protein
MVIMVPGMQVMPLLLAYEYHVPLPQLFLARRMA